jgi:peptide/nickel transport system substrate-binding protein
MNDLVCADQAVIPIVARPKVTAIASKLKAAVSGWDNDLADLHNWYRDA